MMSVMSVLCMLATSSCRKTSADDAASVFLDESVLSEAVPLQIADAWYPVDSIYSSHFYVFADTILIVENIRMAGHFLDFYHIPTQSLIAEKLSYGEGPGEWLFAQIYNEGNALHAIDYVNARFCYLDIEKVLRSPQYMPELIPYPRNVITSPPVMLGDSVFCVNPFHYVNRRMRIDQQPPRFYGVEKGCRQIDIPMDFDYMTVNVGQGTTGSSDEQGKLFFASHETSTIEFYDSSLKLLKKVCGPLSLPEANLSVSTNKKGHREVCYKRNNMFYTYDQYTACNDRLYFLYKGVCGTWDEIDNSPSYILCFDWDGNLLESYRSPVPIKSLSASRKEHGTFYATVKDEEDNPKLIKLTPQGQ